MACERRCLARDTLLQVAVAGDGVDEVIEGARAGLGLGVEEAALEARGVGEADGRRQSLAERTGRYLDAVGVAVLGVAGCERSPCAQGLEVVELETVAAELELDVLGERTVTHREGEPVATDPLVVTRIAPHDLLEQEVGGGGKADGRSRMPVSYLLDGVCRENFRRGYGLVVNGSPLE